MSSIVYELSVYFGFARFSLQFVAFADVMSLSIELEHCLNFLSVTLSRRFLSFCFRQELKKILCSSAVVFTFGQSLSSDGGNWCVNRCIYCRYSGLGDTVLLFYCLEICLNVLLFIDQRGHLPMWIYHVAVTEFSFFVRHWKPIGWSRHTSLRLEVTFTLL